MIRICVKQRDDHIHEVDIHGHAGSARKGQDLVCAGVSSIAVGMMNALDRIKPSACDMQMEEAHINIQVILQDDDVQLLLQAMLAQLETMQITYHKYIQISYQEV